MDLLTIAIVLFFCFTVEGVFGLGGTVLSLTILSFFFDIKDLVMVTLLAGIVTSLQITLRDFGSVRKDLFVRTVVISLFGLLCGLSIFRHLSSPIILKIFGGFLLYSGASHFLLNTRKWRKQWLSDLLVLLGGIMNGIFGTGGPMYALAMERMGVAKSQLRATIAAVFTLYFMIRLSYFLTTGTLTTGFIQTYWPVVLPIIPAVFIGRRIHMKISEATFHNTLAVLFGCIGLIILLR